MRAILMSSMLIIVAIAIYMSTIGGDEGAKMKIRENGEKINQTIERINLHGSEDFEG